MCGLREASGTGLAPCPTVRQIHLCIDQQAAADMAIALHCPPCPVNNMHFSPSANKQWFPKPEKYIYKIKIYGCTSLEINIYIRVLMLWQYCALKVSHTHTHTKPVHSAEAHIQLFVPVCCSSFCSHDRYPQQSERGIHAHTHSHKDTHTHTHKNACAQTRFDTVAAFHR